jgi:pSer/pThr/pTyr-binding forkhead associated (FHA) protein
MAKRLLVIDRDDQGHFFLSVDTGTMTIGGTPNSAEIILRDLNIARIHCEVEVDEDAVAVEPGGEANGEEAFGQMLHPGDAVQIGQSRLRLEALAPTPAPPGPAPAGEDDLPRLADENASVTTTATAASGSATPAAEENLAKHFLVVDGADKGRTYRLPLTGVVSIGKSKKHSDITLNDLYVGRVHCELKIDGDTVQVTDLGDQKGTLINGQKIKQQNLAVGDILRVGNSQLKLERTLVPLGPAAPGAPGADDADVAELGNVEVIEDDGTAELAQVVDDAAEAKPGDGDSYTLPHSPVDELLKLEDQDFGYFHIGTLLGRGQSGLVFRADDKKNNRVVALKVYSPDFPKDDAELQHFVQALKVTPQLHHANLVTMYGAGRSGPFCWTAREYIDGESTLRLIQRIHDGEVDDWTCACRVAVHLGKVLDFLHRKKVIHGNITPRNVLIRKGDHVTKLADLMLNQALEGSRLMKAIVKKKQLAELSYLAPEQIEPAPSADALTDIYSLGALLYALLRGRAPFIGDTSEEILTKIREAKVSRPSKRREGIPGPFEDAVLKMMARRRADRYQSATEMLAAVEPIAAKHKVEV